MARRKIVNAEKELKQALKLITRLSDHLKESVPFYGYQAQVEDLQEENYELQRACLIFNRQPSREKLVGWLTYVFDQLRMAKGLKPGKDPKLDKVGTFLGFSDWVQHQQEILKCRKDRSS